MELGDAHRVLLYARSRPTVECRQCGTRLYVPDWTEHLDTGRTRHLWSCEGCGCSFETTVYYAAA